MVIFFDLPSNLALEIAIEDLAVSFSYFLLGESVSFKLHLISTLSGYLNLLRQIASAGLSGIIKASSFKCK